MNCCPLKNVSLNSNLNANQRMIWVWNVTEKKVMEFSYVVRDSPLLQVLLFCSKRWRELSKLWTTSSSASWAFLNSNSTSWEHTSSLTQCLGHPSCLTIRRTGLEFQSSSKNAQYSSTMMLVTPSAPEIKVANSTGVRAMRQGAKMWRHWPSSTRSPLPGQAHQSQKHSVPYEYWAPEVQQDLQGHTAGGSSADCHLPH